MPRRRFLRSFGVGAATALSAGALAVSRALLAYQLSAAEPVVLGKENAGTGLQAGASSSGVTYRDAAAVCVDSKDNVYVFTRGVHPVIVFDRNGKFLRSWDRTSATRALSAAIGPDDLLYLTDDHGRGTQVHAGRQVRDGGTRVPAPAFSGTRSLAARTRRCLRGRYLCFRRYQRRVHKYSPAGKLLFSWG
jgi:hypothetical protein